LIVGNWLATKKSFGLYHTTIEVEKIVYDRKNTFA